MAEQALTSPEALRQLLSYDQETGKLFWRTRPDAAQWWNTRYAGNEAFTTYNSQGYRHGSIFDIKFSAHRVVWALVFGEWPDQIDHISGNKTDNRIVNLRNVNRFGNMQNQKIGRRNRSGVVGVFWVKTREKWVAQIRVDGKSINLGYFSSFDDAVAVRKAAEIRHGFHANHGRKAA